MTIDSKWYDILAWINRVFMPAAIVLVTAILGLCQVEAGTVAVVTGIMAAVNAFLGALLQSESKKYFKIKDEEEAVIEG